MIGNILIVDDDLSALKLLRDILTIEGHIVRPFNNGELALRSIMAEAPELIVLDIRMPGFNGFEVCRRIKTIENLKDLPVIFISAASDLEDKVRAFEEGGVDYITKPFQKEEVIARVRTHIALSHTMQQMKIIAFNLQKNEESLKIAQKIAQLGHWELNVKSGQFICSEEMYRILGLSPQKSISGQDAFLQSVHPDDRADVAAQLNEVMAEGPSFDMEYRIVLQNGEVRVVHGKGEVVNLNDGVKSRIIGTIQDVGEHSQYRMMGVIQDITERKQIEEELRIAAVTFETHDAIIITDADANIIKVNQAFTFVTGYSPEEVLGKNPRIMKSGKHDKPFYVAMFQKLLSEGRWNGEVWDKRKNGEIYPRSMTITAVKDSNQKLTQYVGIFRDISDQKKNEELTHKLAFYDSLTQLPNRRMLYDRLKQAIASNKRSRNYGAVIFLDLDNFKPLNDRHGHVVGDLLLIEVARRISSCVREMDTVARFGGDEFVVMLSELNSDKTKSIQEAGVVAEKIRLCLAQTYLLKLVHDDNSEICVEHHCSSSIGVTLFDSHEGSQEGILKQADAAMYRAKEGGRNSICFYE